MKTSLSILALTLLFSGATMQAAQAQDSASTTVAQNAPQSTPAPTPSSSTSDFEIKVGEFTPNGVGVNNNGSFSVGAEYEFSNGGSTAYSLSADWVQIQALTPVANFGGNLAFFTNTNETAVPVLLNAKWYSSGSGSNRFFAGLGAGAFLGNYNGFAYQGELGYQFTHNLDFSLRYIGNGGSSNVQGTTLTSLFGADVGYKF